MKHYFINLKDFKITSAYRCQEITKNYEWSAAEINVDTGIDVLYKMMQQMVAELLADVKEENKDKPSIETRYILDIKYRGAKDANMTRGDAQVLTDSIASLASTIFLTDICLSHGRKREHRLDIPPVFEKSVSASRTALKRAINYDTKIDNFNFSIYFWDEDYGTVHAYTLVAPQEEVTDE